MTTPQEFVRRAAWFRTAARPSHAAHGGSALADSGLATNAYLWSGLPLEDQAALREMNVRLTAMAIAQCASSGGAANQVDYGSLICIALSEFAAFGVHAAELTKLSRERDVVFPWSLLYGNARTPFNPRLTRLPLAIAYARTVDEVVFWVNWVRRHGLSVSIRSGNNSYEGLSSSNQVIVDLTFLTLGADETGHDAHYRIDAAAGLVHAASGTRLGVLYTALAEQNLVLAGGQCAPVCIGGLVGTGGIGYSTRAAGWAADQLVEVECVLADGSLVVANAGNEHAELYRACKGAGAAGLCVMTRLTLRVHPARRILFYNVGFNLDQDDGLKNGAKVLEAWQNLAANAPDGFSSVFAATASDGGAESMLSVNGEFQFDDDGWNLDEVAEDPDQPPDTPEDALWEMLQEHWFAHLDPSIRPGRDALCTVEVSAAEAATIVASLVPMPVLSQWKIKSRSTFGFLTADELEPVFQYLRKPGPSYDVTSAVGYLNPWLLGGASNRIDPESAVVPVREGAVMWVHAGAQWNDPALEADALAWVEGLWEVLGPTVKSDAAFYGIPELELGSQTADEPDLGYVQAYWSSPTHDFVPFLLDVKQRYDPDDVFRFSQSIPLWTDPGTWLGS